MAKINILFDTIEKTMVCTKDGETIDNVVGCYLGKSYMDPDESFCELTTSVKDEENDMVTMTRLMASVNDAGEEQFTAAKNDEKEVAKASLAKDIAAYFNRE